MKKLLVVLLLLTGCAAYAPASEMTEPPLNWPKLQVIIEYVPFATRFDKCGGNVLALILFGAYPEGCAIVYLQEGICRVFLPENPSDELVAHELAHCEGRDHPGSTLFKDHWEKFQKEKRRK